MEQKAYHPAPDVLSRLKAVTLVAVIGPTAAGKSTLITAAMEHEPKMHLVINNTSREPRKDEQNGVDYMFRSREEMLEGMKRGEFVQVAPSVFGDIYATTADGYATKGVAIMAILADAMQDFRTLPFKSIRSVFVVPPDYEGWQGRIAEHGFEPEQLHRRLVEAERSLVFGLKDESTRFVINQTLDLATEDLITLALNKPMPTRLQADQSRAREVVRDLLEQLRIALQRL
jgi:guanylate kinase